MRRRYSSAAAGALVTLVGQRQDVLEVAANEIAERGGEARVALADVSDAAAIDRAAAASDEASQGLSIRVTCAAGPAAAGPPESQSAESWRGIFDTDLTGVFYACQAAGRRMLARRHNIRYTFFQMEERERLFDLMLPDRTRYWDVIRLNVFYGLHAKQAEMAQAAQLGLRERTLAYGLGYVGVLMRVLEERV